MQHSGLTRLIALGEGQHLEFKRGVSDDLGREIVSFANAVGGTILIGVEDNGTVVGVSNHNRLKGQVQSHARNCDPPVAVTVESAGTVLVVTIPQSRDKPHASGGKYYLREGATAQQMSRTQMREFFFKEGLVYFDAMVNTQFDVKRDLHTARYRQFAKAASIPSSLDMTDTLRNLGLLTRAGMTNAGALVLGKQGSRFLVNSTVSCALFRGTDKAKVLDHKVFDDDIASNYHNTIVYLESHLNTEYIITSERRSRLELPVEALREAVVNALAHRDYRNPADTQVCTSFRTVWRSSTQVGWPEV
jgi:ATP-dependent DNA helicase RecG